MPISYTAASGAQVADLVDKIEDVIEGHPNTIVSIACIVVAMLAQDPDVSPEKIQTGVKAVSELLAAVLFTSSGAVN